MTEEASPERFVSAGRLPSHDAVQATVDEAQALFRDDASGELSSVYPALSAADPARFGLAVASVGGDVVTSGDASVPFPLMSIAKPFVFALVCDTVGLEEVRRRVGVNATGLAFNSAAAVERDPHGRTNPMVNPGAIATTSLVPGGDVEQRWQRVLDVLSRCAGRPLELDDDTLDSARATNHRNRALANLLTGLGALHGDPGGGRRASTPGRAACPSPRSTSR